MAPLYWGEPASQSGCRSLPTYHKLMNLHFVVSVTKELISFHADFGLAVIVEYKALRGTPNHNKRYGLANSAHTCTNNMARKRSFKGSRSSMIFLHSPSNAVTKLRIYYLWRDSLLVKPLDMSFIFVRCPHSTNLYQLTGNIDGQKNTISTCCKVVISQQISTRIKKSKLIHGKTSRPNSFSLWRSLH